MALTQVYTAVAGHIITAARWNNEFGNIYTNGTDVAFPLTKAVSFAGYTVTYDLAGVSHITSPSTTGFLMTVGAKSGAPGTNGGCLTVTAGTFTDSSTSASGTAALWNGVSIRTPTLHASQLNVTTTDANTVYIEGPPTAGTNQTFTESNALFVDGKLKVSGDIRLRTEDSRTNSVLAPLTVQATTTGSPAAGIGVGISFHAESADEAPCIIGRTDFALSDVSAGSEDSYFDILLRTAGAAANTAWRWVRTTAYKGIFTHSNTADRTYSLPDFSCSLAPAGGIEGPTSTGSGSAIAHAGAGTTVLTTASYSGVHFYESCSLASGQTLTIATQNHVIVIFASDTITIGGTITTTGGGFAGGAAVNGVTSGNAGTNGMGQPGGGGGRSQGPDTAGGDGGDVLQHGVVVASGGSGNPSTAGVTYNQIIQDVLSMLGSPGGGGGGSRGANTSGAGGRGAGHIILIAPNIVFEATAVLNTSGTAGAAPANSDCGGGGGGGAGNVYIFCNTLTDGGVTYTQTGGAGGLSGGGGEDGEDGADGIKQINIYG